MNASARRGLYPAIEPSRQGYLSVGDGHEVYWEECGNSAGKAVVFLHGGPGAGSDAKARRFFDPARYRIFLFDQRGCGRSRPHASLEHNTTWHLVADIERLRTLFGVERWQVFGGSWGSTLALAYAQAHPGRVTELVLRGIFLLRKRELDWFYQEGASYLYPDRWEEYVAPIPLEERGDLVRAFYRRLTGSDPAVAQAAARAWAVWEGATSYLLTDDDNVRRWGEDEFALAVARIECHYFVNGGFMTQENQLLEGIASIRRIPAVIVQGRHDVVCPMYTAWDLHRAWPEAELQIIGDAGHSAFEPGITDALVRATDRFAS
ncbi:MAG TPA: prolyl aminopeptidase [Steroidobacteraceae bacterium]|jgi:proline iminopeptidase|nr:prolyl aminopeptidase [Steroidobacteraceae bacterium]